MITLKLLKIAMDSLMTVMVNLMIPLNTIMMAMVIQMITTVILMIPLKFF
jgi:hypothetical protein